MINDIIPQGKFCYKIEETEQNIKITDCPFWHVKYENNKSVADCKRIETDEGQRELLYNQYKICDVNW